MHAYETKFLKPREPGLIVRDPETGRPLGADGEEKPLSPYWHRRLNDGDVVAARKPKSKADAPSAD